MGIPIGGHERVWACAAGDMAASAGDIRIDASGKLRWACPLPALI